MGEIPVAPLAASRASVEEDSRRAADAPPPSVSCPEVKGHVWLGSAPRALCAELPALYKCPFSTLDDMARRNAVSPDRLNACVLEDPRHVILFVVDGRTVTVLNRLFDIEPADVERLVTALGVAVHRLRRVRLETKWPAGLLSLPHRTIHVDQDMLIEQPLTVDDYLSRIGRSTRKTLRESANRLAREHPGWRWRVTPGRAVTEDDVRQLVSWTAARMQAKGQQCGLRDDDESVVYMMSMVRRYGFAAEVVVEEEVVARTLCLTMGDQAWPLWGSFNRAFERQRMGLYALFRTVCTCLELGCTVHLLWGTTFYKERLAAVEHHQYRVTVYPSRLAHAADPAEACRAVWAGRFGGYLRRQWAVICWHAVRLLGRS